MGEVPSRLAAALAARYRIERELGAGGMATVYLAEDLKHDRKVALKVLRPELAAVLGAERFVHEIKTTAALQHPHILPLFDSGTADSFLYYVMPYIEGETLRAKLDREKQLGIEEAVKITTEVADALDYAHRHGVIHRDIKPENILLHDGRPMVADFGIALAVSAAAGGRMTETGLSLGTPHYMSPEQATAEKEITAKSDVYSLGIVLYEMLTGDPPHTGSSAQQIIMKIVTDIPRPVIELRKSVPPNVAAALGKSLEKLPADRFDSAKAFAEALTNPAFTVAAVPGSAVAPLSHRRPFVVPILATVVVLLAVALIVRVHPDEQASRMTVRFTVPVGLDSNLVLGGQAGMQNGRPTRTAIALSPDGTLLVVGVRDSATSWLVLRHIDEEVGQRIAGTEGASSPFFSPDGEWIGFFLGSALKRVSVLGGQPETMVQGTDVGDDGPYGVTWADGGTIVFGARGALYRVAPGSTLDRLLAPPDTAPYFYLSPAVLPGSKVVLFQRWSPWDPANSDIVALELSSGDQQVVLRNAMSPRYMPPGYLLFAREGVLLAVRFDSNRLETRGEPVTVAESVMQALFASGTNGETGLAQYGVSLAGDLAYAVGGPYPEPLRRLVRIDRSGNRTSLDVEPRAYWFVRESPDGTQIVFHAGPGQKNDIGVHDLARGVTRRLNVGGFTNQEPTWSPDGQWLAFSSDRAGPPNVYRIAADGTGDPVRLAPSEEGQSMSSWSSSGVVAFLQDGNIWVLPPDGTAAPFFESPAFEFDATFSPDGRWLAYASDQSGPAEIYVRPYPGPDPAIQISNGGGTNPAWSPDGRDLYYVGREAALMVVDMGAGLALRPGRPRVLFQKFPCCRTPVRGFDVLRDGSFLAIQGGSPEFYPAREIHVVLGLGAELQRRMTP